MNKAVMTAERRPRLGFAGVGWIGRNRLEAIAALAPAIVDAIADPNIDFAESARQAAPDAALFSELDEMLLRDLDGVVIATPSALHAEQAIRCLEAGMAVFCQKPLGRDAAEVRGVLEAARRANRLLGVDLSYRHLRGTDMIRSLIQQGEIGAVFAADLVFHNAYGPARPWAFNPRLSGGGCVIDLGIHLVDLALWTLGFPNVSHVTSRLFARGLPLQRTEVQVEDYAVARLDLETGATVSLACSWNLPAGRDAVIEATFYGTRGALALRNVDGSFYDFVAERYDGRTRTVLVEPPDDWGGRAAVAWASRLARDPGFDPAIESMLEVSRVLDSIYGRYEGL